MTAPRLARGLILATAIAASTLPVNAASAHGPCGCLFPTLGAPGTRVSIVHTPAYRVLFNPKPGQLGIAPQNLASAYRPDAPTRTLLARPRAKPTRTAVFRIPRVAPGIYMVLTFDGTEGGAHNTWDYLHVLGPAPRADKRSTAATPSQKSSTDWFAWLAAGIALGATTALLCARSVSRRRR